MSIAPLAFALVFAFGPTPSARPPVSPIGALMASVHAGEQLVHLDSSRDVEERADDAGAMLATVNAERRSRGLASLAFDAQLCAIAREHAVDMAVRSYFSHSTPEGLSPFERMNRAHYRFSYAGENLALDQSVSAASAALWTSTEHRSNILQPHFERVGIAAVSSEDGEIFVEDFSD